MTFIIMFPRLQTAADRDRSHNLDQAANGELVLIVIHYLLHYLQSAKTHGLEHTDTI